MSFLENVFYYDISILINHINLKKSWDIDVSKYVESISISKKQKRCLSRIWDSKNWDINKQCNNPVGISNLCFRCLRKKNSSGMVNEYPDEDKVIKFYRDGINNLKKINPKKYGQRDIYKEINLKIYKEFLIDNRIKISKKKSNKQSKMNLNISESNNNIISNEEKLKKEPSIIGLMKQNDIREDWWMSEYTDKLIIKDNLIGSEFKVAVENNDNGNYLLNKKQVIVGEFKEWEDTNNDIPTEFKNNENVVLDPNSAVPLQEYILYENSSIYHDLSKLSYKNYRYDDLKNTLVYTNEIEFL